MDVKVIDGDAVHHQINVDTLSDGSDTQIIKMQMGDAGLDGGLVSSSNPVPVSVVDVLLKSLKSVFGRFRFNTQSGLVVDANGSSVVVSSGTVTTVTTVTTMTTGNISIGDAGKAGSLILMSQIGTANVYNGLRTNTLATNISIAI